MTLDELALGMTRRQVRRRLGPPRWDGFMLEYDGIYWEYDQLTLWFTPIGILRHVRNGNALRLERATLHLGDPLARARALLGEPILAHPLLSRWSLPGGVVELGHQRNVVDFMSLGAHPGRSSRIPLDDVVARIRWDVYHQQPAQEYRLPGVRSVRLDFFETQRPLLIVNR
ncbi:MAG: hypothetical protein AB1758_01530, partial [Candidatus Eremiobacterota bacterium]